MRKLSSLLALAWAIGTAPSVLAQAISGPLTFQVGDAISVATNPAFVAVADFNSDGVADLIVSSPASRKLTILLGNPGSGFSSALSSGPYGASLQQVAAGDLNNDGIPDVAVADNKLHGPGRLFIFIGVGDGTLEPPSTVDTGNHPSGVAIGEFDGAPGKDVAVSNLADDNVSLFFNRGQGTFSVANNFPAGNRPTMLVAGAFGGNTDIATSDIASMNTGGPGGADDVTELLSNGFGGFQNSGNFAVGANAAQIASADFNNDGVSDIAVANGGPPGSFTILLNNGAGFFSVSTPVINCDVIAPTGTCNPNGIAAADFNLDGNTDLAIAMTIIIPGQTTTRNVVLIFTGNGDGTFDQAGGPIDIPGAPSQIAAADFDGDGVPDVAVTQVSGVLASSNIRLLKNTTQFNVTPTPTATATPTGTQQTPAGTDTPATPGTTPGETPGTTPGETPGTTPGTTPGGSKLQGDPCSSASECAPVGAAPTGYCVNGRCCDTACTGLNQRCDQNPPGVCVEVPTPSPSPTSSDSGGGTSIEQHSSGGCSTGGSSGSPLGRLVMLLVPAALWVGRRRQPAGTVDLLRRRPR